MIDFIVILILAVLVCAAIAYIYRAKKRGQVCIGCSQAASCPHSSASGGCGGGCSGGCGGCTSSDKGGRQKPSESHK